VPDLDAGHTVLVVAHGNVLRALIGHLDRIPPDDLRNVTISTGEPLLYAFPWVAPGATVHW
jgi:2,3-bisphosphoglycerate-dependent phosphoglycerate mutase